MYGGYGSLNLWLKYTLWAIEPSQTPSMPTDPHGCGPRPENLAQEEVGSESDLDRMMRRYPC